MKSSICLKTLPPLLTLLMLLTVVPTLAATVTVTVTTSKASYSLGEMVTITGTVKEDTVAKANVLVNVEVRDPAGTLRFADVVKTGTDGSFTASFRLAATLPTGTYTVKAVYGGVSATKTFSVAAVPTFVLSLSPKSLAIPIGWYGTTELNVEAIAGYAYEVTLEAEAPEGVTASLTKATGTPSYKSMLVLTVSEGALKGTFTVTITATGEDGTVESEELTLVVIDAPPAFEKVYEISDKLDDLTEEVATLRGEVADANSTVLERLDALSSNLTAYISQLQSALSALSTDVSSAREAAESAQAAVGGISTAAYAAAVLALIAAVAAIYSVIVVTRKLAT